MISKVAQRYDVPYITDNATGLPFIGNDLRKTDCDLMLYSMDKDALSPTSGLIIGKEEYMVPLRKAMGFHSNRYGTISAYGKAAYSSFDPGKTGLVGQIAALKALRDKRSLIIRWTDKVYEITMEEFAKINPKLGKGIEVTKSYNFGGVEVNYAKTWIDGEIGIPMFSSEDIFAGVDPLFNGFLEMGIGPTPVSSGNFVVMPGFGTLDDTYGLLEENMRYALKAMVKMLEIISKHAGTLD